MPSIYQGDDLLEQSMRTLQREFQISDEQLRNMISLMTTEMERGLSNRSITCFENCESRSSLKMLHSHIGSVTNFTKKGCYLAIDLGGTNFRVLLLTFKDPNVASSRLRIVTEVYALPEDVMVNGESFFDHIAKCMGQFCKINGVGVGTEPIPMGFTFSFPLRQERLSHAVLIDWAKGFRVDGVIGNDVVQMLSKAIAKREDVNCKIIAIVNDTVGTLISCVHGDPTCKIGLIVGSGCNACYMENLDNISGTWCDREVNKIEPQMCINMEWGSFGDNGVLENFRTEYDRQVDSVSNNPNGRTYEKMISGRYLGEIVRHVLCKLVTEGVIFENINAERLFSSGAFKTSYVFEIENTSAINHHYGPYVTVRNVLKSLNISADDTDCEIVKQICSLVSTRAAHLCAAGVAAVALKIKTNHPDQETMTISVAVDGTVYKKHPTFSLLLAEKTRELCQGSGLTVNFVSSYDGSGKGAALIAAAMHNKKSSPTREKTLSVNEAQGNVLLLPTI